MKASPISTFPVFANLPERFAEEFDLKTVDA